MGEEMSKRAKRKKKESISNWIFYIAFAILIIWIIKMILKIDPPFEDLLANVPWISVAFGAGALYMKVTLISKDIDDIEDDLKKLAPSKDIESIQKELKEVRDMVNRIMGRLKIT